jgi:hypothetical protein
MYKNRTRLTKVHASLQKEIIRFTSIHA